jgi:hypothetical protein
VPLLIEESTRVGAPPEAVWKLLSDPQSWRFWWAGVKNAESVDRHPLHDGSELNLAFELGALTVHLRPKVEVAQPGRALLWTARSMGVVRHHAFYIEPGAPALVVRERESFEGWGLPLFRLLRFHVATAEMFRRSLRGLRKLAERS